MTIPRYNRQTLFEIRRRNRARFRSFADVSYILTMTGTTTGGWEQPPSEAVVGLRRTIESLFNRGEEPEW